MGRGCFNRSPREVAPEPCGCAFPEGCGCGCVFVLVAFGESNTPDRHNTWLGVGVSW